MAELLARVASEIDTKYVSTNEKVETILYVHILNALYGIIKAALL